METGPRVMVQMMNNNSSNTIHKKLSIQVCLDGLSFFTQDIASQTILEYQVTHFDQKKDPSSLLTEVVHFFKQQTALKESYKKVEVVYINALFSLVPKAIFDSDKLTDYLKFNTKILATDFIAYDTIDTHDIVNVYIPYTNINNYFFDTYGSFDYYHGISLLIKSTLDNDTLQEAPKVTANLHKSSFDIIVTHKKKLLLANSFEFHSKEDFIYYLLFTFEQLELNPETTKLELMGYIEVEDPIYTLAYTYIRNVSIANSNSDTIPNKDYILSTLA